MLDAVERSPVPGGAELRRGVLQPEPASALDLERLLDGHREIDELELWREQGELDAIRGQRMQRQQRLERRDAPAGDQHTCPGLVLS